MQSDIPKASTKKDEHPPIFSPYLEMADTMANAMCDIPPLPKITYFNNAGSSPTPRSVLCTVSRHSILEHLLDGYTAADLQKHALEGVYTSIAKLIHASSPEDIALVESATVAWTRIFYSMVQNIQEGDVILCSEVEYAANVVAIQKLALERDVKLVVLPSVDGTGVVDLRALDKMLQGTWKDPKGNTLDPEKIFMVCITHIPTNCGVVNPVNEIGNLIQKFNQNQKSPVFYLVDACQSTGQMPVNVQDMKCHALTATGRKYLRGPRGTGFLYVHPSVMNALVPSHVDHFGVPVSLEDDAVSFRYQTGAKRFEFWESNVANRLGLGAAVDYALENLDLEDVRLHCSELGDYLRSKLHELKVYVHHGSSGILEPSSTQQHIPKQCGIVAFSIPGRASQEISRALQQHGFLTSVSPPTSTPFDSKNAGLTSPNGDLVRISLTYFNTREEIDSFYNVLEETVLITGPHGTTNTRK